jgi:hypothetical protein
LREDKIVAKTPAPHVSRRAALSGGGALIVSFTIGHYAPAQEPSIASSLSLPGSLKGAPTLDSWISINASGSVIVFTGKCELGQGIKTALSQIAAEELNVPIGMITLVTSDTDRTANEGFTSGSQSMQDSGTAILHAAAQARELLIGLAARRLSFPAEQLKAQDGAIVAPNGESVPFGSLVAENLFHVKAQPASASKLRSQQNSRTVGQSLPRIDIPSKVTG